MQSSVSSCREFPTFLRAGIACLWLAESGKALAKCRNAVQAAGQLCLPLQTILRAIGRACTAKTAIFLQAAAIHALAIHSQVLNAGPGSANPINSRSVPEVPCPRKDHRLARPCVTFLTWCVNFAIVRNGSVGTVGRSAEVSGQAYGAICLRRASQRVSGVQRAGGAATGPSGGGHQPDRPDAAAQQSL